MVRAASALLHTADAVGSRSYQATGAAWLLCRLCEFELTAGHDGVGQGGDKLCHLNAGGLSG